MANLITWDFFRSFVGTGEIKSDSSVRPTVEAFIQAASIQVENYLGRHVFEAARTEITDVRYLQRAAFVRGVPISTLTEVYHSPIQVWDASTALASDQYRVTERTGRIAFLVPLTESPQSLRIDYTGGLVADVAELTAVDVNGAPTSEWGFIATATAIQVQYLQQRRLSMGSTSDSLGRGRTELGGPATGLIPVVKELLDPARMRRMN